MYMYSKDHFSPSTMGNTPIEKDVFPLISNNPKIFFANLNIKLGNSSLKWEYNEHTNKCSISTSENAYIIQIPIVLANMLGMYDNDVSYDNTMVFHHPFKANWWYNLIDTDNFVKVMSDENNISAYENLYKNNYPVDGDFYLGMSYNDEYKFERPINLKLHRPKGNIFLLQI